MKAKAKEFLKFCIVILSSFGYVFNLGGDFVFDDSEAIIRNDALKDDFGLFKVFTVDFWGNDITDKTSHKSYRPLTVLTFKIHKYLDGSLVAYHFKLINLLLHIVCCCLVFITFKLIFTTAKKINHTHDHKNYNKHNTSADDHFLNEEFLAALLFAVHPIHVESVSGVVGRADILSGIFFFSSIILYHNATSTSKSIKYELVLFVLVVFSALASFLSKETGITTLIICAAHGLIIIDKLEPIYIFHNVKCLLGNNRGGMQPKSSLRSYKSICCNLAALGSAALIFLYSRWAIMGFEGPTFHETDNPAAFHEVLLTRILSYNYIYFLNLLLLIWPHWLCFDWSMGCVPLIENIFDYRITFVIILIVFLGGLLYFVIFNYKVRGHTRRVVTMSMILMIIPFLPASNLIMPVGFVVAERILYIPSAGFCMLVAIGYRSIQMYSERISKVLTVFLVILFLSFSLKTYQRARQWQTEYALFNSGLSVCPLNAKVHYNVGRNAVDRNDLTLARAGYEEAIRLNPKYYQAMNNLANLLKDQKQLIEAERLLHAALALKEDFYSAWNNLGIVLAILKRPHEAEVAYRKALKYKKNYTDCYYNLGNLYLEQKIHNMALEAWFNATTLNPKHVSAWNNILALLDNTGQINRALDIGITVLQQLPDAASLHFNLGNLYGKTGDFEKAEHHFASALRLAEPNVPAVYYTNFGVLYHRGKKYENAKIMYKSALEKNPSSSSAKKNLETVERLLRL